MEYREIIILHDEDGDKMELERLDVIPYEGKQYAVLMETSNANGDLLILQVDQPTDSDETLYDIPDSEQTVTAIYNLFKERHRDEFTFSF